MDVLAWCLIIVVAGNETTRNGTSGGMLAFIEHPDQLRKLQREPELLAPALEEIVFHARLGSLAEKVSRMQSLAVEIDRF